MIAWKAILVVSASLIIAGVWFAPHFTIAGRLVLSGVVIFGAGILSFIEGIRDD